MSKENSIRYKLAPQTKFYDSMTAEWKPFVMFNHPTNIRSRYCNTDIYGLRFNNFDNKNDKLISIFDEDISQNKKIGVLVGNSLAFGEGVTSDQKTISSYLSKYSNYHFFNFCGRGFSGYQEIVNFLLLSKKIKNLERIIVVSGVIDSFLPYFIKRYDENLVPIFGYDSFSQKMRSDTGWKNRLFKTLFGKFFDPNLDWSRVNSLNWIDELFKRKKNQEKNLKKLNLDENLKEIVERNIMTWSTISKGLKVKVDFIFQPVGSWSEKKLTTEEVKLFDEENKTYLHKIYKYVDKPKYELLKGFLEQATKKHNINFLDGNCIFNNKRFDNEWIFLSRFHATDIGNAYIADSLIKDLALKQ